MRKRELLAPIICECGCGQEAPGRTARGEPRRFIHRHHRRTLEHNAKIGAANKANGVGATPTKVCPRCKEEFPRKYFGKRYGSLRAHSASYCPPCTLEVNADRARKHWAAHPELAPQRAAANRVITLRRHYGITVDEYEWLLSAQGGVCKICRKPETGRRKSLSVDHCHASDRIRGLLCDRCNRGIGLLRDDLIVLTAAVAYLEATAGTYEQPAQVAA
jgi:hypothetical protein